MGEKHNKNKTRLDLIRDVRAEETSQKSRFSWKCVEVVFFPLFFFHGETRWEPEKVTAEERPQCVGVPEQARLPGNASAVWLEGAWRDSALCCTAIPLWKATEVWKNLKPVVEQERKKKKGLGTLSSGTGETDIQSEIQVEVFVVVDNEEEFYICCMSSECHTCVPFDQDFDKALDFGGKRKKQFFFFTSRWQRTRGVNEHWHIITLFTRLSVKYSSFV